MTKTHRVRDLREALQLSQAALAARTGALDQSYVARIEAGRNKATSFHVREALARGFGLELQTFVHYLDGTIDVHEAISQRRQPGTAASAEVLAENLIATTAVRITDDGGPSIDVPILELIRAYRLIMELGGFEVAGKLGTRLSDVEQRMSDMHREIGDRDTRMMDVEARMADINVQLAEVLKARSRPE